MNERLITYLAQQKQEREAVLSDYADAVAAQADALEALRVATAKVEEFGDVSALEAEVEQLQEFIDGLSAPDDVEAEQLPEQPDAEAGVVNEPVVAAAQPMIEPGLDLPLDTIM